MADLLLSVVSLVKKLRGQQITMILAESFIEICCMNGTIVLGKGSWISERKEMYSKKSFKELYRSVNLVIYEDLNNLANFTLHH